MQRHRYDELDALRGIAALVVVLFHAGLHFAYSSPLVSSQFTQNGYLMVDFFFVLSGFVIASSYWDRLDRISDVFVFQFRRAARLFPLHLMTLFAFLGIEFWLWRSSFQLDTQPFEVNSLWAFVSNLFLLQSFTEPVQTFNKPAWSISVEFYTYVLFALVCVLCAKRRWALDVVVAATIALSGFYLFQLETLDVTQKEALVRCLFSFGLGIAVFRLKDGISLSWMWSIPAMALPVLLLSSRQTFPIPDQVFPVLFSLVIASLVCSADSPVKSVLRMRPLQQLGELSYGIYLWHGVVFWILPHLVAYAINGEIWVEPVHHDTFITLSPFGHSLLLGLGLFVTYLCAALSYRWVEKPVNDWARRATTPTRSLKLASSGNAIA